MPPPLISTRRDFLRISGQGLGLAALTGVTPKLFSRPSFLAPVTANDKILIVIHLAGGNDGLNTLIPYTDDNYHRLRPQIGISAQRILKLNDSFGLHPACSGLHDLYDNGQLAAVHNVAYESPNRTHFGANRIWATASTDSSHMQTGWLGRYLDTRQYSSTLASHPAAIHFSTQTPLSLAGGKEHRIARFDTSRQSFDFASETTVSSTLGERNLRQFLRDEAYSTNYLSTPFARNLRAIAQMIGNGLTTQIYHLTLNGFDTHSHQRASHENALHDLSANLSAFQKDLRYRRVDTKVLTVAFSEFGRRPSENLAQGTDHGTSGPMFILGSEIKGGLYGTPASLEIEPYEDLKPTTDFRQVYVTLLENWLNAPAVPVLGGTSSKLPIL